MDINDFSACWSNGVALCALMDALVPGACPELARLKPYHKLNNIRLALKLANKFFALPLVSNQSTHNTSLAAMCIVHVGTLGMSFTRNCLYDVMWRPVVALRLN